VTALLLCLLFRTYRYNAEGRFAVRDASEQALAYVYSEDKPGRRSAAKLLTRDEAPRIAANANK
jgi:hypothetical protein